MLNFGEKPRPGPPIPISSLPSPTPAEAPGHRPGQEEHSTAAESGQGKALGSPSQAASPSVPSRQSSSGPPRPALSEQPGGRVSRVLAWSDFGLGSLAAPLHHQGCEPARSLVLCVCVAYGLLCALSAMQMLMALVHSEQQCGMMRPIHTVYLVGLHVAAFAWLAAGRRCKGMLWSMLRCSLGNLQIASMYEASKA